MHASLASPSRVPLPPRQLHLHSTCGGLAGVRSLITRFTPRASSSSRRRQAQVNHHGRASLTDTPLGHRSCVPETVSASPPISRPRFCVSLQQDADEASPLPLNGTNTHTHTHIALHKQLAVESRLQKWAGDWGHHQRTAR
jgi:hypothetical protein